ELKRVLHAPLKTKDGEKSLEEKEGLMSDDLEGVKKLRDIYNGTDLQSKVLHEAERLEGSVRNTGIHAAGIIIAPKDLTELLPVATAKDSDLWVTQIEGSIIEEAGVIKMDFLGLKTLSIIKTALTLIKENHDISIDIDSIPLDDEKTFQLYQKADTNGTFQFESPGMQKYLKDLKPDKFDDLIAMNALYRPGPLAYIPNFIDRKHGKEKIAYDLPEMEEYLKDTYGITVYQEQVMLLSQKLAGFSKGDADVLRKAMGKKDRKTLDKMKSKFIEGATEKKLPLDKIEKIWTDWEAFAQYAFNKSHSTCYALLAYQTAYLKARYPSEYMAAVLNHAGSIEKITFFMEECKRMGLKVLGPDVNESKSGFAVNRKGEIRFGMRGLKGVGDAAIENLIAERGKQGPYKNIFDLIKRVNQRTVNKKSLESLAYSGAFDCFTDMHRAQYFHMAEGESNTGLEKIVKFGNIYQSSLTQTTNSLFGDLVMPEIATPKIANCEQWSLTELLNNEKEVTGMFMSGHPLDHFRFEIRHYNITTLAEYNEIKDAAHLQANPGRQLRIAALVIDAQHRVTKTGKNFGVLTLEDYTGKTEIALFSDDYMRFKDYLDKGKNIMVMGSFKQNWRGDGFEFKAERMNLLETIKQKLTKQLILDIEARHVSDKMIEFIDNNIKKYPGRTPIKFTITDSRQQVKIGMRTLDTGFEMNDEMAGFLTENPELEVQVISN
ncbi:MAG TPA: DNA polymerase III subunit alpha, partial [Chitinophagaceae bacterium]|nr:DNA polymerase III subunit alpha [Chitinophagaceae bacterium]